MQYTGGEMHGSVLVSLFLTVPVRVQTIDSTMTFRGFAVQSRQSTPTFSSDANFLGSFTNAPSGGDWQLWNCPSAPVSTHLAMITSSLSGLPWLQTSWQAAQTLHGLWYIIITKKIVIVLINPSVPICAHLWLLYSIYTLWECSIMWMQEEILHSFVTLKCSYSDSFTDVPRRFASGHCWFKMRHIRQVLKHVTLTYLNT